MKTEPILQIEGLVTQFTTERGIVHAVNDVSFELHRGETLGIVGESGCGKSVTNFSILKLIQFPPGKITQGKVLYDKKDLFEESEEEIRNVRGKHISMIFQDPLTSLNPVIKIWVQVAEALMLHHDIKKKEAKEKAIELLQMIGIPDARERANDYPHQFSGGMRQRVMIAMALSCNPDILIADEPTTALDVTIQAQILDLIKKLSKENSTSVIMITHDLGVVADMCDTICVMYAGRVVERAPVNRLFYEPQHPYTKGLLSSIPRLDQDHNERLHTIEGAPPDLIDLPKGCPFYARCAYAMEKCATSNPPEYVLNEQENWKVACYLHETGAHHGK
ncbi:MAG: ABC transporter ATP-binding protein [Sphaerochaetaceae bacterium]|nr:ABC transporter ATP-binding protein [Sphaerochaetaceae bacterium]MDC7247027.1 ABC transporter ATP-binding protein [Sphaerochaetaceae bacterium]